MNNTQKLQQEIEKTPDLPVLPPGISYLLKTLVNDDITYQQLAHEIEKFPSIAIKIVATANSAWASPILPITSLRDACSRIGLPLVRSISIALSVSQVFIPTRCPSFNAKTFWVSSLLTAEAAYLSAKDSTDICPDTARLAGLLHNIGLLWLADKKPLETSDAMIKNSKKDSISLSQILSEKYNLNLYTVGGHLATVMELPEITAFTIANYKTNCTDIERALINNHQYAKKIASAILSHEKLENVGENNNVSNIFYKKLENKLPGIQSMAQALFLN